LVPGVLSWYDPLCGEYDREELHKGPEVFARFERFAVVGHDREDG
jgi:hypothetical protein